MAWSYDGDSTSNIASFVRLLLEQPHLTMLDYGCCVTLEDAPFHLDEFFCALQCIFYSITCLKFSFNLTDGMMELANVPCDTLVRSLRDFPALTYLQAPPNLLCGLFDPSQTNTLRLSEMLSSSLEILILTADMWGFEPFGEWVGLGTRKMARKYLTGGVMHFHTDTRHVRWKVCYGPCWKKATLELKKFTFNMWRSKWVWEYLGFYGFGRESLIAACKNKW